MTKCMKRARNSRASELRTEEHVRLIRWSCTAFKFGKVSSHFGHCICVWGEVSEEIIKSERENSRLSEPRDPKSTSDWNPCYHFVPSSSSNSPYFELHHHHLMNLWTFLISSWEVFCSRGSCESKLFFSTFRERFFLKKIQPTSPHHQPYYPRLFENVSNFKKFEKNLYSLSLSLSPFLPFSFLGSEKAFKH